VWGILIPTYINLKGGEGMEQLYTIREFCKAFRIARDTYYIWKNTGIVETLKIGGCVRITETEIQRLLTLKG